MEAVGPALLADLLNVQVGVPTKCLDCLVQNGFGLGGILLATGSDGDEDALLGERRPHEHEKYDKSSHNERT